MDRDKTIEKLGIGGMGAVHRVEDTNIDQEIVLNHVRSDKLQIGRPLKGFAMK